MNGYNYSLNLTELTKMEVFVALGPWCKGHAEVLCERAWV